MAIVRRTLLAAVSLALIPVGTLAQTPRASGETINIQNYGGTTGNMHAVVAKAKASATSIILSAS